MDSLNWPTALTLWLFVAGWVHGIAVAHGFWMTALAAMFPPLAWVLSAMWISDLIS
jgi:hypothetical protein